MRTFLLLIFLVSGTLAGAQTLKDVSNADNTLRKHQQVLASRLLSWSTGNKEQINYVSVGRYANYFGFVKMRVSSAHSLKRSEVGRETLSILTDEQQQKLFSLLEQQKPYIKKTHAARLLANEFLDGLLTDAYTHDDKTSFTLLASQYAVHESQLGVLLATNFSQIIETLEPDQFERLSSVRNKHTSGSAEKVSYNPSALKGLAREDKQEIFNLAARLLSWITGDLPDFTYETIGKPSQHFGFVSMRVESNHGVKRGVLADEVSAVLSSQQREILLDAANNDKDNLDRYLQAREQYLIELTAIKDNKTHPLTETGKYAERMAELEAEMTWDQAVAMKSILDSMTSIQVEQLLELRGNYTPDGATMSGVDLFQQCAACHRNSSIAPDLSGVVDRAVASAGFVYSPAMIKFATRNDVWSVELLDQFLQNPQHEVPGTIMSYKGISDSGLRMELIKYLAENQH